MLDSTSQDSGANSDSADKLPPVPEYLKTRGKLILLTCARCPQQFWRPQSKVASARFCSPDCRDAEMRERSAVETRGRIGPLNRAWKGGVSKDNMRYRNRQIERWPEKEAARRAVKAAIRAGKLTRLPCEVCGEPKTHAHHDDYGKPLAVRFLCRPHHRAVHGGVH